MGKNKLIRFHVLLNHNPMAMFDGYKETDQLMVGPDGYLQSTEGTSPVEEADRLFEHLNNGPAIGTGRSLSVGDVVMLDNDIVICGDHGWKPGDWRLKDLVMKLLTEVGNGEPVY